MTIHENLSRVQSWYLVSRFLLQLVQTNMICMIWYTLFVSQWFSQNNNESSRLTILNDFIHTFSKHDNECSTLTKLSFLMLIYTQTFVYTTRISQFKLRYYFHHLLYCHNVMSTADISGIINNDTESWVIWRFIVRKIRPY